MMPLLNKRVKRKSKKKRVNIDAPIGRQEVFVNCKEKSFIKSSFNCIIFIVYTTGSIVI